jgi:hypothetical protein
VTPVLGTGCAGGRPPNWIFEVRIGTPRQMPRSTGAYDQPSKVSIPGVEYRNRLVMLRAKEPGCSRASNQLLSLRHRCRGTALAERRAHAWAPAAAVGGGSEITDRPNVCYGSSSCTNPAGGLASALGGPIVCERPTALFHVPQPLEESVFFQVVMRRHATAVRNRPGQYRYEDGHRRRSHRNGRRSAQIIKLPALAESRSS